MINFHVLLSLIAALMTAGIAAMTLYRDPRSFVHRVFALGLALFAVEAALTGIAYRAQALDLFLLWQSLRLFTASLLPVSWLLFSVSFARADHSRHLSRWKWVLVFSAVTPVALITYFGSAFFSGEPVLTAGSTLLMRVGWSGYLWHLLSIVFTVIILINLEKTFRHATGHMRWQTKFLFLGIGGIFAIRLFIDSQAILFRVIDTGLDGVALGALVLGDFLVLLSLLRGKPLNVSLQLSHAFLYNSFTTVIVGVYFIALALLAWLSVRFEWIRNIHIAIFLVFVAAIGMAILLLSDRLRMKRKRFISRHFARPQYDYQKIWEGFTTRTTSVTQIRELCNIIVRMVSETIEILSVTIWLVDEKQERLTFGGSTVFAAGQGEGLNLFCRGNSDLLRTMSEQSLPLDLMDRTDVWAADLNRIHDFEGTKESRIRYCVPLKAAGQLIGIMTLSEKVFYEPLSVEESELVKTIADQAAAGLLNLRLSERLRQTKELEAFQSMSAFFMHDLKNLASKLSLVTQNLPVHIDNPEFRADALRTISQSVAKINAMSSRLSLLSQKVDLLFQETNLNELIAATVGDVRSFITAPIEFDPEDVPPLPMDREQIRKAVENLLMNAADALAAEEQRQQKNPAAPSRARENPGTTSLVAGSLPGAGPLAQDAASLPVPPLSVSVTTGCRENRAVIAVRDNGCGMSKEFIETSLFRPFQTTKKTGMGIGLFHCKTIVEAHGGRIEVESEEGRGTTFRILLPLTRVNTEAGRFPGSRAE